MHTLKGVDGLEAAGSPIVAGPADEAQAVTALSAARPPRVAIVHYWLVGMRGGERVLEELCRLYPEAEIFTLVLDRDKLSSLLAARTIHTSFLQSVPGARRHYPKLLALMPFALEHLDLTGFDLVISSESGPAKGVVTRPDALRVCYCHSPMRYVWDHYHLYRRDLGWLARLALVVLAPPLRIWDVSTSHRVDVFVANSMFVARRIERFYNRSAVVVNPPVHADEFAIAPSVGDFYLYAGQLVGYKRADLAVDAFTQSGRKLVVIGEGAQMAALRRRAGPNVHFLGRQSFAVLKEHLATCRALVFPAEEDFGIVPLEAMASGRPVIAYDSGGARETVTDETVGLRFPEQTVASLNEAVARFEAVEHRFDPPAIRRHAQSFSPAAFAAGFKAVVDAALASRAAAGLRNAGGPRDDNRPLAMNGGDDR